jgi:hypothetical protein
MRANHICWPLSACRAAAAAAAAPLQQAFSSQISSGQPASLYISRPICKAEFPSPPTPFLCTVYKP